MIGDIIELAPGALMCRGDAPDNNLLYPQISNCFVVREGDSLFVVDTGAKSEIRKALIDAVNRLKDGAKTLYLINTIANVAHFSNNDAITGLKGFDKIVHLVHEKGEACFDYVNYNMDILRVSDRYFDVFEGPPPPWRVFTRLLGIGSREKGIQRMNSILLKKYGDVNPSFDTVTFLKEETEESIELGPVTVHSMSVSGEAVSIDLAPLKVDGWRLEGAIIIHTGAPSPDHMMVFFPKKKLLLVGDLTVEMFPHLPEKSTGSKMVESMNWVMEMNKEDLIDKMADSHHPGPMAGHEAINRFLGGLTKDKKAFKEALLSIMKPGKKITVKEIYRELRHIRFENPVVDRFIEFQFPKSPIFLKNIIVNILLQSGCQVEGNSRNAAFTLPEAS